jgi:pimeloyl-ACP methyl ester carboxylesterase/DNA-binding CsgD family transcriptional regulator
MARRIGWTGHLLGMARAGHYALVSMQQEIRYLDFEGRRLAYSTFGDGPPIVVGPRWVSHLEEEWEDDDQRPFYLELAASYRVVRFDRIGCGLSSRELTPRPSIASESRQLEAVVDAVGGRATIFASSCCCLAASELAVRDPLKVEKIVYFGGYATRHDIPDAMRASLVQFTRLNWGLAAQMFASLFDPHASGDEIQKYMRMQRKAATAEAASIFLELDLGADLREVVPQVAVPALVLPRRGDRTVPISRGRELASLLPNARFVPLAGDAHVPWKDDQRELFRALAGFLHNAAPLELAGASPLTSRETEVLRLVATGMSNREIASTLVLSEHTVHRHIANILRKLAQSTRAAAATHATRVGLI